jgi:DNA-binding transcriptional MerR regulator
MLRHYDTIGLLRPALVDQASGHLFYEPSQLLAADFNLGDTAARLGHSGGALPR